MKKKQWIMSSCMGAVLALSMGAVAIAADPPGGVPAFCASFEEETGLPQDVCVACFNPGRGDKAVCLCKGALDLGLYQGTLGECVAFLHTEGVP
jgi:hypothetical protein